VSTAEDEAEAVADRRRHLADKHGQEMASLIWRSPRELDELHQEMRRLGLQLRAVVGANGGLADLTGPADEVLVAAGQLGIRLDAGDLPGALAAADAMDCTLAAIRADLVRRGAVT
jgi:hypothetical protein